MQVFRPDELELTTGAAGSMRPTGADAPLTRSAASIESADRGFRTGVWESGPGTAGRIHQLRPGDVFYTPAGERMTWVVPAHIRKVWVHRRTALPGRIRRKLGRMLARTG
jgi:uncharacterized cupin superfamily protein